MIRPRVSIRMERTGRRSIFIIRWSGKISGLITIVCGKLSLRLGLRLRLTSQNQTKKMSTKPIPSHPPPFITPPPTNTHSRIPQVTQSQTDDNEFNNNAILTPYEEDPDNYIHYHDPDLVLQTPVQEQWLMTLRQRPHLFANTGIAPTHSAARCPF